MKTCSYCGEPTTHTLKMCPACQDRNETRDELLLCRALLRKLDRYFGDSCTHRLANEIKTRLKWPKQ